MIKWIECHPITVIAVFCILMIIEVGTGVWRLPKEFRSSIIPRIERVVAVEERIEERISYINKRIDMLLDLERLRTIAR